MYAKKKVQRCPGKATNLLNFQGCLGLHEWRPGPLRSWPSENLWFPLAPSTLSPKKRYMTCQCEFEQDLTVPIAEFKGSSFRNQTWLEEKKEWTVLRRKYFHCLNLPGIKTTLWKWITTAMFFLNMLHITKMQLIKIAFVGSSTILGCFVQT